MRRKIQLSIPILLLIGVFSGICIWLGGRQGDEDVSFGDVFSAKRHAAPEFVLSDLSGQKVSLEGCKGKVVLLGFWTAS